MAGWQLRIFLADWVANQDMRKALAYTGLVALSLWSTDDHCRGGSVNGLAARVRRNTMTKPVLANQQPHDVEARSTLASQRDVWRIAPLIYWGGAALLVPWIVGLALAQPNKAAAYHRNVIGYGLLFLFSAGSVATGALCLRRSRRASLAAIFTATLLLVAAWFASVAVHPVSSVLFQKHLITFFALALPVGLMVWVSLRITRSPPGQWNVPRWAPWACVVFPALFVPVIASKMSGAPPVVEAHSMRVVWTGLDLFELAAMLATATFVRRRSPWLVYSATILGGLLCCDAWFNVLSSDGLDFALSIALAFVELPLALYSLGLAARAARRGRA